MIDCDEIRLSQTEMSATIIDHALKVQWGLFVSSLPDIERIAQGASALA